MRRLGGWAAIVAIASMFGCGDESFGLLEMEEDEELCHPDSAWYECQEVLQQVENGAVAGGWKLPAAVRTTGERQHVSYDGAPAWNGGANCSNGLRAGAQRLGAYLLEHFQTYQIQGFNCRTIRGTTNSMSLHGTGRAIDVMIRMDAGRADNGKGDPIGNWLVEHAQQIGIQYVIWDRTQWKGYTSGRKDSYYSGVNPHYDHLHVELTEEAAAQRTPWFTQKLYERAPGIDASFEGDTIANDASRANFRLDNRGSGAFDGVVFGYDVPDHLKVTAHFVWKKGPTDRDWVQVRSGGALPRSGKVDIGHVGVEASRRLVLVLEGTENREQGVVQGWVRNIDEVYKGATAFDVEPTKNLIGKWLRQKVTVTVPTSAPTPAPSPEPLPDPATFAPCDGVQSYAIPPRPAGVTDNQARKLAQLHCAFRAAGPTDASMVRWMGEQAAGMQAPDIADVFWGQDVFAHPDWDALTKRQFVVSAYRAVLGRDGTTAEIDAAVASLDGGLSRARVLNSIAQSAEFTAMTSHIWQM